jgi:hypothetical protein
MIKSDAQKILNRGEQLALYAESLDDEELHLRTKIATLNKEIRECNSKIYSINEKQELNERAIRDLLLGRKVK